MPRQYTSTRPGQRSEFPRYIAEDMLARAPYPSHNKPYGRRPHAHYDRERDFELERSNLRPLEDAPPLKGQRPVLWAYPATYFNYANQTARGQNRGRDLSPGPHRIIADKNKKIHGMVTHPIPSNSDQRQEAFIRAPQRVRVNYRGPRGRR